MRCVSALLVLFIISVLCGAAYAAKSVRKIDVFGDLSCRDERPRLDNFAIAMRREPGLIGYVIAYGGRHSRRGEARARLTRIRDSLVRRHGLGEAQVRFIDGGYREDLTIELYAFPPGASPPTAEPTVDPAEVKMRPGRIKRSEMSCVGKG